MTVDQSTAEQTSRALAQAREHRIDAELISFDDYDSRGLDWDDVVRSLVLRRKAGEYLFALVPMGRRIAWPRLRAAAGTNKLHLPDEDEAFEATGYRRGTISPLGSTRTWPVYADILVPGRRIGIGSGVAGYGLWLDADALLSGLAAELADISDPAPA